MAIYMRQGDTFGPDGNLGLPAGEQTDGFSGFIGGVTVACGDVNGATTSPTTARLWEHTFEFRPKLTSEPTAPEASLDSSAVATLVDLTGSSDMSPWTVTHATSSRDADGSAHAAISLGDGKAIEAAGDEYGIGQWGNGATDALGDPVTFTFTVSNTSSAIGDSYAGSHALYQDVFVPTHETGFEPNALMSDFGLPAVQKGDWIVDVTVPAEPPVLEGHQCLVFF